MSRSSRFGFVALRRGPFQVPGTIKLDQRKIALRHPHDHGSKEDFLTCFVDDVYGLSTLVQNPKNILDIGANVGFFSLAARGYFPEATIHSYEPNPRVLHYLGENATAGKFQFFPEAVGASEAFVSIIDESDSNQASTSVAAIDAVGAIKQVALETAIERMGGHVDLLKMDCEGAEWDIFKASDAWCNISEVRMEYHLTNGRQFSDVHTALSSLSFRITKQIDQGGFGIVWATNTQRHPI